MKFIHLHIVLPLSFTISLFSCKKSPYTKLEICLIQGDSLEVLIESSQSFEYQINNIEAEVQQELKTIFNIRVDSVVSDSIFVMTYKPDSLYFYQKTKAFGIDYQSFYNSGTGKKSGTGSVMESGFKQMQKSPQKIKLTEHYELIFSGYEIFYQFYRLKMEIEEFKVSLLPFFDFIPILKKEPITKGSSWSYRKEKNKGAHLLKVSGKFEVDEVTEDKVIFSGIIVKSLLGKSKEYESYESKTSLICNYDRFTGWINEIEGKEELEAKVFLNQNILMPLKMKGTYNFKTR